MEDTSDEGSIFDLELEDDDLLALIKKPLEESETYWDNFNGLKAAREDNMNLWMPNHWGDKNVYDFQEEYLYQDPRIFISVETIISVVNSRIPVVDIMPAQDTVISEQAAKDLSKVLHAHSDKFRALDIFRIGARNLLLKRIGFVKLRWDPLAGKNGEIVPEAIPPEDIVVDKDARWGDNPRFTSHKIRNKTVEELLSMFPDSKEKILEMAGVDRRDKEGKRVAYKSQLAKKHDIWETWFHYFEDGYKSGVALTDIKSQYVLGKIRNPNWNYEDEEGFTGNFLDIPIPPFFPINYLNDGTSYIDLTSMVEQAAPLQRILDRRGFQIMENAEMAGSGLVFNTQMIDKADIGKLVGSPDERIGVKGSVRDAVARIAPPPLPSYVIEDKLDARNEIDNIFATQEVTRGERSGNKTLGQDQMQREQNYTRMDDIARAIERTATNYYRYLIQMMKVYYTEEHYFKAVGEDGKFDYLVMKQDAIEDGIDLKVGVGSMLPVNKQRQQEAMESLIQQGLIDPLSVYEVLSGGNLASPQKLLERFILFKTDPIAFMGKAKQDEFSREAFIDVQILNRGEMPLPRDEIGEEYLKFMNNYILTGSFEKQPDLVKQMYMEWMKIVQAQAQKQMEAFQTQAPTQEDMDKTNQGNQPQQNLLDPNAQPPQQQQAPQEPIPPDQIVNYKDAPEEIKRQMEAANGYQPSKTPSPIQQTLEMKAQQSAIDTKLKAQQQQHSQTMVEDDHEIKKKQVAKKDSEKKKKPTKKK